MNKGISDMPSPPLALDRKPSMKTLEHIVMLPSPTLNRRHTLTLVLGAAFAPAMAAAAGAPSVSKDWVLVVMKLGSRQGDDWMDNTVKLPLRYGVEQPWPMFDKTPRRVLVNLLARRLASGEVAIQARFTRGEPAITLAQTNIQAASDKIVRTDVTLEGSPEKLALVVMPITPPAGFDPAKEQLSLATPWP